MSSQQLIYAVFAMMGVMLLLKLAPMLFLKKKIQNKFFKSFLAYIPYAVLTSMAFPEVFHSTSSMLSATIGVIAAIMLSYFGKSLIVVALSSTAVVFVVEQIMNLMGK